MTTRITSPHVLHPRDAAPWESTGMAVAGTPTTPSWMWHHDLHPRSLYTYIVYTLKLRSLCGTTLEETLVPDLSATPTTLTECSFWAMLPPASNWVGGRVQNWVNLLQGHTFYGRPVFQGPTPTSFSDLSHSPKFSFLPSYFPFTDGLTCILQWVSTHLCSDLSRPLCLFKPAQLSFGGFPDYLGL